MIHVQIRELEGYACGSLVMTIPRSENGWKSILLENVNRFNLNRFPLKRLIPIEHDLSFDHIKHISVLTNNVVFETLKALQRNSE